MARMEKGKIAPKMARIQDIADTLQCPVSYLFCAYDETTEERATVIADILRAAPPEGQDAIIELVANVVAVMNKGKH